MEQHVQFLIQIYLQRLKNLMPEENDKEIIKNLYKKYSFAGHPLNYPICKICKKEKPNKEFTEWHQGDQFYLTDTCQDCRNKSTAKTGMALVISREIRSLYPHLKESKRKKRIVELTDLLLTDELIEFKALINTSRRKLNVFLGRYEY